MDANAGRGNLIARLASSKIAESPDPDFEETIFSMRFDFAISFASTQRTLARQIADELVNNGYKVFFDEDFEHELLGRDGADYFNNIFFKESQFCIALFSTDYDKSAWTQLERRAVQAREFAEEPGYLIPILVDGHKPEWLLPTKIYYDLTARPLEKLIEILSLKIEESGIGQFGIKNEILLDKEVQSIHKVTNNSGAFNLSFQHDNGNIDGGWAVKVTKDPNTNEWKNEKYFCRFVGGNVYENDTYIIGVPRYARDKSIWVHNKFSKSDDYYKIPIVGDYDHITAGLCTDSQLIVSIEHGESHIFNMLDFTFHRFKDEIPWMEEYNGVDIPSSIDVYDDGRMILGVHKVITTFNKNGEFESQFNFPEIIHSIKVCRHNNTILIASRDSLYCLDLLTHRQKFKHRLASSFPRQITCVKNLIAIYTGFGGMDGCIELLNAKSGNSLVLLKSMIFEHSYYDVTISDDGNSLMILNEKWEMHNGKREKQRLLTILSRPN